MKTALTAVAVAIAAALIAIPHPQAQADTPSDDARASQPSADASQTLRRYTLTLLHILSNPHANQWQRYRKAMTYCAEVPPPLDEIAQISIANDASPLDRALATLSEDLCADLDQRLAESRTVGLLVNEPESMDGYVLIPGYFNNHVHLIDHLGRIVHSWNLPKRVFHAKLLDNGNLLTQEYGHGIAELAPNGNILWQYEPSGYIHHDFLNMPNGNVLILMRGFDTMQEAIAMGANSDKFPTERIGYPYLIEVRPTGSEGGVIVWEWSAWDYIVQDFDPSKPNYGDPSEHPELIDINFLIETPRINPLTGNWVWLHANALDYNPDLDQVMLSPRNFSELWIIDRSASPEEVATRNDGNADNSNTPPPYTCAK